MQATVVNVYKNIASHPGLMHARMLELEKEIRACQDYKELADFAYALHKALDLADDTRKTIKKLDELAQRLACLLALQSGLREPIRTEFVTASLDMKEIPRIPRKAHEPEAYAKLMRFLGIPEEYFVGDDEMEVFRPHWPGLVEYLSRRAAEGLPLPDGIDPSATFPEYRLRMVKKKSIT